MKKGEGICMIFRLELRGGYKKKIVVMMNEYGMTQPIFIHHHLIRLRSEKQTDRDTERQR